MQWQGVVLSLAYVASLAAATATTNQHTVLQGRTPCLRRAQASVGVVVSLHCNGEGDEFVHTEMDTRIPIPSIASSHRPAPHVVGSSPLKQCHNVRRLQRPLHPLLAKELWVCAARQIHEI